MKKKLARLLRAYVRAETNNSWKGVGDPENYREIEEEVVKSKKKLWEMLDELLEKTGERA